MASSSTAQYKLFLNFMNFFDVVCWFLRHTASKILALKAALKLKEQPTTFHLNFQFRLIAILSFWSENYKKSSGDLLTFSSLSRSLKNSLFILRSLRLKAIKLRGNFTVFFATGIYLSAMMQSYINSALSALRKHVCLFEYYTPIITLVMPSQKQQTRRSVRLEHQNKLLQ